MSSNKQNVVVTGCSSGIGLAIARGLHVHGYRVIATVRKSTDVAALQNENIECMQLDLADSDSINRAVTDILDCCENNLYALINNGAYGQPGAVEDLSRNALVEQFQTNVFGTQELTNKVLPVMRAVNNGRIIQISSILGLVCLPYRGAYNASKYALEALTDTLRLELANSQIKLSLIEPGPIRSEFRANALKAFHRHIDTTKSVHHELYESVLARLQNNQDAKFTLPADAVVEKVLHALESKNPKIRYLVTTPAQVLGRLKRFLPDRAMDKLLGHSGDKPKPRIRKKN